MSAVQPETVNRALPEVAWKPSNQALMFCSPVAM